MALPTPPLQANQHPGGGAEQVRRGAGWNGFNYGTSFGGDLPFGGGPASAVAPPSDPGAGMAPPGTMRAIQPPVPQQAPPQGPMNGWLSGVMQAAQARAPQQVPAAPMPPQASPYAAPLARGLMGAYKRGMYR